MHVHCQRDPSCYVPSGTGTLFFFHTDPDPLFDQNLEILSLKAYYAGDTLHQKIPDHKD